MSNGEELSWRAWIAAAVFVSLMAAAVLIIRRPEPAREEVPPAPPVKEAIVPAPPPPLTRADLIDAAALSADAFAQGKAPPRENTELVGRRFTLRLPFGCAGPTTLLDDVPAGWSYDETRETLRVRVAPEAWTDTDFLNAVAGDIEFEAAEGFWISRTSLRSGECPSRNAGTAESPAANLIGRLRDPHGAAEIGPLAPRTQAAQGETLGLIELFQPNSRRAARRNGKPYGIVTKVSLGEINLAQGLRLIVEGRLAPLRGGQSIVCHRSDIDIRPVCIIGVNVARVAITDASGERTLAAWQA